MLSLTIVSHPLPAETKILASKPSCPCKGATWSDVQGTIKKSISNNSGLWYYLDIGITVKSDWVKNVL